MPTVAIYGGAGNLGKVVVKSFKEGGWTVISVDFHNSDLAQHNFALKGNPKEDSLRLIAFLKEQKIELDALISVAGGFTMDTVKDVSVFDNLDKMFNFNVVSAIGSAHVAANTLKEGGLLVLTGASAAFSPTPAMLAYGTSKAACHHVIRSLAQPDSGLPKGVTVTAICPIILDTPANRSAMPTANFDSWTPLDTVAQLLLDWSNGKNRPKSGEMIQLKTENKKTQFISIP